MPRCRVPRCLGGRGSRRSRSFSPPYAPAAQQPANPTYDSDSEPEDPCAVDPVVDDYDRQMRMLQEQGVTGGFSDGLIEEFERGLAISAGRCPAPRPASPVVASPYCSPRRVGPAFHMTGGDDSYSDRLPFCAARHELRYCLDPFRGTQNEEDPPYIEGHDYLPRPPPYPGGPSPRTPPCPYCVEPRPGHMRQGPPPPYSESPPRYSPVYRRSPPPPYPAHKAATMRRVPRPGVVVRKIDPHRVIDEDCYQMQKRNNPGMPDKMARQLCVVEGSLNYSDSWDAVDPSLAAGRALLNTGIPDDDDGDCGDDGDQSWNMGQLVERHENTPWQQRVPTDPDWPYDLPDTYTNFLRQADPIATSEMLPRRRLTLHRDSFPISDDDDDDDDDVTTGPDCSLDVPDTYRGFLNQTPPVATSERLPRRRLALHTSAYTTSDDDNDDVDDVPTGPDCSFDVPDTYANFLRQVTPLATSERLPRRGIFNLFKRRH